MHGVGKVNVAPRDAFPPFPSHYVPCRLRCLSGTTGRTSHIMRELRAIVSNRSLAVDNQRKIVTRTLGGDVVGHGGQTFTICGDFGLVCGVYVVPDTALSWVKKAMSEVIKRHESAGVEVPQFLYMDCGCCSGKAGSPQSTLNDTSTSVAALWRSIFSVKLDAMLLMLRIGREMNTEHPCCKKFLIDLSHAIFVQYEGDRQQLMKAREAAGLEGPPTRAERVKFIRRVVGEPECCRTDGFGAEGPPRAGLAVPYSSRSSWYGSGQPYGRRCCISPCHKEADGCVPAAACPRPQWMHF